MPVDNCPRCGGSGWIFKTVDGTEAVTRCACDDETRSERFASRSGIPPLYANASTENYSLPKDNPIAHSAMQKVMINVRTYAREFPVVEKPGLLLIGETGVGKTHLAVAALNALIQRGFEGVFFDYQTLLDRIRSGYDRSSGSMDKEAFRLALAQGASGYVVKSINPLDLPSTVRQVVEGTVYHPRGRGVDGAIGGVPQTAAQASGLTERELSILKLVAEGLSNLEIANRLFVTEQTVKFHLSNIYRKLGVANRTEATRYAYRNGLTD